MLSFPIKPMLLQTIHDPFNSPDYLYEWKVDGIRCIMFYEKNKVRLQSRTGKDCTKQFPELWTPQLNTKKAVLDGELTVFTNGKPDFEGIMKRYHAGEKKVSLLLFKKPAIYIVWDILWLDGQSTMDQPLFKRKQLLNQVLDNNTEIQKIDWVDTSGSVLWNAVKDLSLEGMVVKKKDSRYTLGQRSSAWQKIKNYQEALVNVFGYSRRDGGILVGTGDKVQGHAIGMGSDERTTMDPNVKTRFFKFKATLGKVLKERSFRLKYFDTVEPQC